MTTIPKLWTALKPLAVDMPLGPYSTNNNVYYPTYESVLKLVAELKKFKLGQRSGISYIDDKIPQQLCAQSYILQPQHCLATTNKLQCNVIGGIFVTYLCTLGFIPDIANTISLVRNQQDYDFLKKLYPRWSDVWEDIQSAPIQPHYKKTLSGISENTVGTFIIIPLTHQNPALEQQVLLDNIVYLKRIFRHWAAQTIPHNDEKGKDNFVHSPSNANEVIAHYNTFMNLHRS